MAEAGQQGLDALDHLDHIGAGLALHIDQHRFVAIGPGRQAIVFRAIDDLGDILQAQRRAVLVTEDQLAVLVWRLQLVVGIQLRDPGRAVEVALGLIDVARGDQAAHIG
ncbi:hypothetical protein FQZ97_1192710 [compost metagenome]